MEPSARFGTARELKRFETIDTLRLLGALLANVVGHSIAVTCIICGKALQDSVPSVGSVATSPWVVYPLAAVKIVLAVAVEALLSFYGKNKVLNVLAIGAYALVSFGVCFCVSGWLEWAWLLGIVLGWTVLFAAAHATFLIVEILHESRTASLFAKLKLSKGYTALRCCLLALALFIYLNTLPFGVIVPSVPTFWVIVIVVFVLLLMYWSVMSELYDRATYIVRYRLLEQMVFYAFTLQLDITLICMSLPTLGVGSSGGVVTVSTSSKKGGDEMELLDGEVEYSETKSAGNAGVPE